MTMIINSVRMWSIGLALCAASVACAPAIAADATYAGTWAAQTEQCSIEQGAEGAPLVLTETSYDQGESHCKFTSVTPEGSAFIAKTECSVEGDKQVDTFTLSVEGETLSIKDSAGERKLVRCP